MRNPFFSDFLAEVARQEKTPCVCGRPHPVQTREILVSSTSLEESARHVAAVFGTAARLWVLSDQNTEAAAGAAWKKAVGGAQVVSRILPAVPRPHPTMELAESLAAEAREAKPDLLVAVGSGVVSDLVKRVSLVIAVPNWCIATAPSVDAFTSATSAILVNGFHSAVPAQVSQLVACDLRVMEKAPRELFLAGLGDLLAKFLAQLDWNLARIVTGEAYCPFVAGTALESARGALAAARMVDDDPPEAVRALTDACLCSGLAMQATGGSRPAASAEHMLAHFWETTHAAANKRLDLHGVLAAVASRIILRAYQGFYEKLPDLRVDRVARFRALEVEKDWQDTLEDGLRPFIAKVNGEMADRALDRIELERRLDRFEKGKAEILGLADSLLSEMDAAVGFLQDTHYPLSLAEVGIAREAALLPLRNVRLLRRRYSGFDLAYELGAESILREAGARALSATP